MCASSSAAISSFSAQPTATPTIIPIRASSASRRADRGEPLVGVGGGRRPQRLGFVRLAEPAALGEGGGQHLLQLRRRLGDDALGLGEALGVEQALDRGLEIASVGTPLGLAPADPSGTA